MSKSDGMQPQNRAPWRVLRWPKRGGGPAIQATCDTKDRALEIALDHANHELHDEHGNHDNTYTVCSDDWWEQFNGK